MIKYNGRGDPIVTYSDGGETENTSFSTNLIERQVNSKSNGSIGRWLWESFDHPTDTLLPEMKLVVNRSLTSWLALDDPASGAFSHSGGNPRQTD